MSQTNDKTEQMYRKSTDNGQITIPAKFRGDESGYVVEQDDNGRIILIPANKTEQITIAQANE